MTFGMLLLLAVGLSMDAFAVSVSNCLVLENVRKKEALATSASFAFFQAAMPLIGYCAGFAFSSVIGAIDHWVAFVLLGFIGGKMLRDALQNWRAPEDVPIEKSPLTWRLLLVQGVATSIDALAVGISFAALRVAVLPAVAIIASVTFVCCLFGHVLGRKICGALGNWAQVVGGMVLIGIGVKILVEQLFF